MVYNRDIQSMQLLHGPERTRDILTRDDGSVLMIAADSAELVSAITGRNFQEVYKLFSSGKVGKTHDSCYNN